VTVRPRWGAVAPAALVLGAGAAALAPAGPEALAPLRAVAAVAEVSVAVVIDFGGGSGAPATVVQCVQVPSGSTDAEALSIAATQQVSYAQSGLLCQIDGYPADGVSNCDASSGQEYYFWSYWHGSGGTWVYANDGPASQPAAPGDVEGWRFQDPGPANPSAPAPGPAPAYASICPNGSSATTAVTAIPPPTTGGAPGATASATTAPAPTTGGAGAGSPPPTTVVKPTSPGATNTSRAPTGTVTSTTTGAATGATTTSVLGGPSGRRSPADGAKGRGHGAVALGDPTADRRPPGSGSVLPAVVVAALVLALVLAAAWRWKKRPETR